MSEWISVDERLPADDIAQYLVYDLHGCYFAADFEGGEFNLNDDYFTSEEVTHWMPLPEPPKNT